MAISPESEDIIQKLKQSQHDLLAALAEDDWSKLAELEKKTHQLIESAVTTYKQSNCQDLNLALTQTSEFYQAFITACQDKREDYQSDLALLKKGQQAVKAYQNNE